MPFLEFLEEWSFRKKPSQISAQNGLRNGSIKQKVRRFIMKTDTLIYPFHHRRRTPHFAVIIPLTHKIVIPILPPTKKEDLIKQI
jgi:hypothetical protein